MNNRKSPSRIWGARFAEGPAEIMQKFNACLDDDRQLAMEDIDGSIAHVAMLAAQEIISKDEASRIADGLEQVRQEINDDTFPWREEFEDVHMNIEARLRELIGPAAGKLHTARSRNDQVATDIRLWTRRTLDQIADHVSAVQQALLDAATDNTETVMPGFTHLQIAQPISYAHYCLAYVEMFERDRTRFIDAAGRLNECPLGSAALAGSPHPIDRQSTAAALGFAEPCRNSLDGVSSRDFALEAVAAATICAATVSRYAEEIVLFATPQFGYVTVGDTFSTGSSIMPQKRNPDAAELLRAKAGRIAGSFTGLTLVTKGLPLAYSKDLQEAKPLLMDALLEMLQALDVLAHMIPTLTANKKRMADDAGKGFSTVTDIADKLAAGGMPFRDAHHVVGQLVALCEKKSCDLSALPINEAKQISPALTAEMLADTTPLLSMQNKTSEGGTSPQSVIQQLEYWQDTLKNRISTSS